jgi:hypothetical protein
MQLFRPYVSLFKDPGIDEATTQLVERYYKNMEYSDTLGQKLNELQNAPFSGDATINKELKTLVNSGLEGLAAEGRYEHSEKELRKLATRFNTLAPGIMQNNVAYSKANQDLKERLEKKEINAQQYELARVYNTYGYEGLKLDPTGRIDQNTYFSPKTIYNDPKPIDMLSSRFKDLLKRDYGVENASVGQNAEGKWTYTVGEDTVVFNNDDVTAVVNSVKKDENVARYIDQMGDMVSVNSLAGGSTADALTTMAEAYKDYVAQLQTGKGSATSPEEIKQYDDLIASTSKRMAELQQVITSGDPNAMAQALKQEYVQEKYNEIDAYGDTQRGLQVYKTSEKRDQDYWKAKAIHEAMLNMPTTTSSIGQITAATDGTGKNFAEKTNNLAVARAKSEEYAKLAEDPNISDELKATYQNLQRAQDIQAQRIETSLKEASDAAISMVALEKADPKIIAVFKSLMPKDATAGDIYQQLQRTFDNPNDQDYIDFKTAFDKANGEGAFEKHASSKYGSGKNQGTVALTDVRGAEIASSRDQRVSFTDNIPTTSQSIVTSFTNAFDDKVTSALKEIKTSPQFTNKIVMPTIEGTIQATNGVNEFFQTMKGQSGRPLKDSEQIIVDGEVKYGEDFPGYIVTKWEYSADDDMFQILLKGTGDNAADAKTVSMKGEQVIQPEGKDKALNSPVQRFATEVNSNGFGLKEGQSRMVRGLWSFPYNRDSPEALPVDYKVTMRGGIETITFYPSGSDKPIGLSRQGQYEYRLDDPILEQMFRTNDFVPTPKRRTTYFKMP